MFVGFSPVEDAVAVLVLLESSAGSMVVCIADVGWCEAGVVEILHDWDPEGGFEWVSGKFGRQVGVWAEESAEGATVAVCFGQFRVPGADTDVLAFGLWCGLACRVTWCAEGRGVVRVGTEKAFHVIAVEGVKCVAEEISVGGEFYNGAAEEVGGGRVFCPEGHEACSDHATKVGVSICMYLEFSCFSAQGGAAGMA